MLTLHELIEIAGNTKPTEAEIASMLLRLQEYNKVPKPIDPDFIYSL